MILGHLLGSGVYRVHHIFSSLRSNLDPSYHRILGTGYVEGDLYQKNGYWPYNQILSAMCCGPQKVQYGILMEILLSCSSVACMNVLLDTLDMISGLALGEVILCLDV